MALKSVIIHNVFCLVHKQSNTVIATYNRHDMCIRFARWRDMHAVSNPLAEFVPTLRELDEAEQLFNAAYSCLRDDVPDHLTYVSW